MYYIRWKINYGMRCTKNLVVLYTSWWHGYCEITDSLKQSFWWLSSMSGEILCLLFIVYAFETDREKRFCIWSCNLKQKLDSLLDTCGWLEKVLMWMFVGVLYLSVDKTMWPVLIFSHPCLGNPSCFGQQWQFFKPYSCRKYEKESLAN